ncbi:uncharacterized protein LOC130367819 isoform X2 [Hyla sarda]|uniref:uncharacterized protein LOC130367819 isoform X2 n=1 Tax=Hyla sarda TaxID=327740 RepID=UPI0024C319FC|nr:uncharacterized protein LOC130367819 isoform X2 [Hyla sarda]
MTTRRSALEEFSCRHLLSLQISGFTLNVLCKSSENMKKSAILCCVTCLLLSACRKNQGSKVKDSLSCVMQYSEGIVTCSWSESWNSTQFVNMTLEERTTGPMCEKMEPVKITPTHLTRTCHKKVTWTLYSEIHLILQPDRDLEARLNVSNAGDEAKPKDLDCKVSADGMINCNWEVRQEVADSVDFTLYYRNEEACQPRCWQKNPGIPSYLFCTCNFTAGDRDNPIQLRNISVKPTESETSLIKFKICKNIKLQPRNLTIEEKTKGETFLVKWKNEQSEKPEFRYQYELCYWKENDMKPKEAASDCPGHRKELSHANPSVLLKLSAQLQPSSNYSVKVRVKLGEENPDHCYKGPWSEWSSVQTFHTKSVQNMLLLSILVPTAVVVLVICAACGCKALIRYKKKLDDRIPNPSKSSIIKSLRKAKNGSSFPYEEHLYVEPCNKVFMRAPSLKDTNLLIKDEEKISRPNSELLQDDDSQCLFNMVKEEYPMASVTDGYKPFSELMDEQNNKEMDDSQFTICAFDGPYLFS